VPWPYPGPPQVSPSVLHPALLAGKAMAVTVAGFTLDTILRANA
jgi:hypothetical protein